MQSVNCFGHNVQGLKDDKLEEVVEHMKQRKIWLYAVQETWRVGGRLPDGERRIPFH